MTIDKKKTIKALSPTSIEQFLQCEARAFGRLNMLGEDEWDEEHGEGAATGTLAHAAAKIWYRPNTVWLKRVTEGEDYLMMAKQAYEMRAAVADNADNLNAADEKIAELGLVKHPYTDAGYVFRKAIDDVAKGPYGNELPKNPEAVSEARVLYDQIRCQYVREQINVVFAERRYKGTLANGVPIHTILDLAIDRGDGRLELIDYKTGWITMSTEEMYAKHQVRMNLLAVSKYDPTLKWFPTKSFTYLWVRPGFETGPVSFTEEQLMDYEHFLSSLWQHATTLTKPRESINKFCGSCARKLQCKKFKDLVTEGMAADHTLTEEEVKALGDETAMTRYHQLATQVKLLDNSRKALGAYLVARLKSQDAQQMRSETMKATMRQNRADTYDVGAVFSQAARLKVDPTTIFEVTKKRIDEVFGDDEEAMRVLKLSMRRGANAPFIDVRSLSKADLKEIERAEKNKDASQPASA